MNTPTAFPLQWPKGWPRTERPESSRFQTKLPAALKQLRDEVSLLGGTGLVLSSNCTLDNGNPKEKGVVAYFTLKGSPIAVPCDRWNSVQDNVTAIARTIEAMRGMERWGAKHMITAMFSGFAALPASTSGGWPTVLQVDSITATAETIKTARARLAKMYHPDGSHPDADKFRAVEDAYRDAMQQQNGHLRPTDHR